MNIHKFAVFSPTLLFAIACVFCSSNAHSWVFGISSAYQLGPDTLDPVQMVTQTYNTSPTDHLTFSKMTVQGDFGWPGGHVTTNIATQVLVPE